MRSIHWLLFVLLPLVLCVGCGSDDNPATPAANPNTVSFVNASGPPGGQVTMDIMIHNAEPIFMVQLPFTLDESACQVTSFEFAGPFAASILNSKDEDSAAARYNTWAVATAEVPAGDHLYATITFTIGAEATSQSIAVQDYEYIGPFSLDPGNNYYRHFPNFGTMSGSSLTADVTHGTLTVEQPGG